MIKSTKCLLVGFTLVLGYLGVDANADSVRTVAFSGTAVLGSGVEFSSFGNPLLNNRGQVAFQGELIRPGVSNNTVGSYWLEGNASLALVIREGYGVPSIGKSFRRIDNLVLNDAGQVAFIASQPIFRSRLSNSFGYVLSGRSDSLTLVASAGSKAPGTEVTFSTLSELVLNDAGQTAFSSTLRGPEVEESNGGGVWSEGGGFLALVTRRGSRAPGTGATFSSISNLAFNDSGNTAFSGYLTGPGVNGRNARGIWTERGGSLTLVARGGEIAPDTEGVFSFFQKPILNNAGQIAFWGGLLGSGESRKNYRGIWSEKNGFLALVARTGKEAPNTRAIYSALSTPAFNDRGQTAFTGNLSGEGVDESNGSGIWSEKRGSLALVVRAGSSAPGTNAIFSGFEKINPVLNNAGHIAFLGVLTGSEVSHSNYRGIWAEDPSGVLTLVVRIGDQLDIVDGPASDLRTVSGLSFGGEGFNDLGQVAFRAEFTDGSSGIFVSNLVAVPEPSSLLLLGAIGIGLLSGVRGPIGGCRYQGARSVGR